MRRPGILIVLPLLGGISLMTAGPGNVSPSVEEREGQRRGGIDGGEAVGPQTNSTNSETERPVSFHRRLKKHPPRGENKLQ